MDIYVVLSIILFVIVLLCLAALLLLYVTTTPYANLGRYESELCFADPCNKDMTEFPSLADPPSVDLSVVVPSYNEESRLPLMMDEAMGYLEDRQKQNRSFSYEVVIVDDGSKDQTSQIGLRYTEKYGPDKVRVLTLEKNRGKGGAVRQGMLVSRGRLCLFADADGASKFSDLSKLEQAMKKITVKSSMGVVCGSRAHLEKESIASRSIFRTFLMYGFHLLVWSLCVRTIKDTQCGFKLLTRDAALLLFPNLHVERWAFDVDLLYLAEYFNIPLEEVSVQWHEVDGSKITPIWSWLQMGRDLFLIRLRYAVGAWKIAATPTLS